MVCDLIGLPGTPGSKVLWAVIKNMLGLEQEPVTSLVLF